MKRNGVQVLILTCAFAVSAGAALADIDGDGIPDGMDNCPNVANPNQDDGDGDRVGDKCDVCGSIADPRQHDTDSDGIGNACDNCPLHQNQDQADDDGDLIGNACDPATTNRWGIDFGIGLSVTVDSGNVSRIESAELDQAGFVRVREKSDTQARVLLETHYFFSKRLPSLECNPKGITGDGIAESRKMLRRFDPVCRKAYQSAPSRNFGLGPFVAIQPDEDDVISAFGTGFMVGWRRSPASSRSFNLGVGVIVDPSVDVLAEGFTDGEEAPKDANGNPLPVRLKTIDQSGFLFLVSFTW